ncbi:hypothetical protein ERJ75_000242000 [Trypanosoma vivax]|uniref:Uncharacterized protein n=1 Tax=Trypanosoma vivax (strain Y486) TaxID=1055687 RepID=G0TY02_TRYVY|nr:hypothetical protein TRVL_04546 [Trypanosoma vivax]KAH8618737.1 hypothetical protein ERJ75_000242000 [Trypanosoma vivax]CCC48847.1 conserved hypothetical protein [Trypanosoma vivax Y486]
MEGAQVKELVQKWRALSERLNAKNKELETMRETVVDLEREFGRTVQNWSMEKANIENTISLVGEQVCEKEEELKSIVRDMTALQQKVDEKRQRNEEQLKLLNRRREAVTRKIQILEEEEKESKERLRVFREAREESRRHILNAIRKIEDAEPQEKVSHQQQVRQLRARIAEVEAKNKEEKSAWAYEIAMSEWNNKRNACRWLKEESEAAENEKGLWSAIVKEANGLACDDQIAELHALGAVLSC